MAECTMCGVGFRKGIRIVAPDEEPFPLKAEFCSWDCLYRYADKRRR